MTNTNTIAVMEVSQAAFMEIHAKLLGAGYDHAILKMSSGHDLIDMTHIGIVPNDKTEPAHAEHMVGSHGDDLIPLELTGTLAGRDALLQSAVSLIQSAEALGFVITIECVSQKPLAMGNHHMQVLVRPARGKDRDYAPPVPHNFDPDAYNWNRAQADSRPLPAASAEVKTHAGISKQKGTP